MNVKKTKGNRKNIFGNGSVSLSHYDSSKNVKVLNENKILKMTHRLKRCS